MLQETSDFSKALEDSLLALGEGQDISLCLARYPEYAERLRPHLEVVTQLRASASRERDLFISAFPGVPFETALDDAIRLTVCGYSPEQVYARYPEYQERLAPWLSAVIDLRKNGAKGSVQSLYPDFGHETPRLTFEEALEKTLQSLSQGVAPEKALASFPYYYDRLSPWVYRVQEIRDQINFQAPQPTAQTVYQPRQSAVYTFRVPAAAANVFLSLFLVFAILFGGTSLAKAASASLPGDVFYPIKLSLENVQLLIAPQHEKEELAQTFDQRRMFEVATLMRKKRVENIVLTGKVGFDRATGQVFIAGLPVALADARRVMTEAGLGAVVRLFGQTTDSGSLVVNSVEILAPGVISESLPPVEASAQTAKPLIADNTPALAHPPSNDFAWESLMDDDLVGQDGQSNAQADVASNNVGAENSNASHPGVTTSNATDSSPNAASNNSQKDKDKGKKEKEEKDSKRNDADHRNDNSIKGPKDKGE